ARSTRNAQLRTASGPGAPPPPTMTRTRPTSSAPRRPTAGTRAASPASSPSRTGATRTMPAPQSRATGPSPGAPPRKTTTRTGAGATVPTQFLAGTRRSPVCSHSAIKAGSTQLAPWTMASGPGVPPQATTKQTIHGGTAAWQPQGEIWTAPLASSLSSIRTRPTTAVRQSMTRWDGPGVLPLPTTTKTISGASALARSMGGTPVANAACFLSSMKLSYFIVAPMLEARWDISGVPQPRTTTRISCGATVQISSWVGTRQERAVCSPSTITNKRTTPAPATGRARENCGAAPPGITRWTRSGLTAPRQTTTSPVSSPSSTRILNSSPALTWRRPAGSSGVLPQTTTTGTVGGPTALPET
ncbi:hypothetical protein KIL84_001914, partial [Mauremys mutica]